MKQTLLTGSVAVFLVPCLVMDTALARPNVECALIARSLRVRNDQTPFNLQALSSRNLEFYDRPMAPVVQQGELIAGARQTPEARLQGGRAQGDDIPISLNHVIISDATEADVYIVEALERRAFGEIPHLASLRRRLRSIVETTRPAEWEGFILLARAEESVIGAIFCDRKSVHQVTLSEFAMEPKLQNSGIGKDLMRRAVERLEDEYPDIHSAFLTTEPGGATEHIVVTRHHAEETNEPTIIKADPEHKIYKIPISHPAARQPGSGSGDGTIDDPRTILKEVNPDLRNTAIWMYRELSSQGFRVFVRAGDELYSRRDACRVEVVNPNDQADVVSFTLAREKLPVKVRLSIFRRRTGSFGALRLDTFGANKLNGLVSELIATDTVLKEWDKQLAAEARLRAASKPVNHPKIWKRPSKATSPWQEFPLSVNVLGKFKIPASAAEPEKLPIAGTQDTQIGADAIGEQYGKPPASEKRLKRAV